MAELFGMHGEAVYGYCYRILRDPVLAEDVMQQVFLEAHRDFERFRGQSSRRTWLFGIAVHRCLDALRSRQRGAAAATGPTGDRNEHAAQGTLEAPGRGPYEQLEHARLLMALEACLSSLPPATQASVLLRFRTNMTYEEMAGYLGVKPDALQMRVARAMPALRQCLESRGWGHE